MARKRKLDKGVSTYVDRHGRERARFRLKGMDCALPHPSSAEYKDAYAKAIQGIVPIKERVNPKSVADLFVRFYGSNKFQQAGNDWQRIVRQTLAQFQSEAGHVPVADFDFQHIEQMLKARAKQTVEKGKTRGGPMATARLHEQLIRLFDFAQTRLKWIDHNPARAADMPVSTQTKGYHSWTEAEIAKFQAKHAIGTRARLALEIALWTGLRRGDVAALGPTNLINGRVVAVAGKTAKGVNVLAAPDLLEAIQAAPTGEQTFLITDKGKAFTVAGLGNWFRERCDEAGLPHCSIHGLRKALARRSAEAGASQQQLKALGQWSGDSEVTIYAAGADQMMLADAALLTVIKARSSANPGEKVSQK